MKKVMEELMSEPGGSSGKDMRHVSLEQVLTPEQLKTVEKLIDDNSEDPEAILVAFKQYFKTQEAHLASHEINSQYLAYLLYARLMGIV